MEPPEDGDNQSAGHVDWAFLPPTAMHVIGTLLQPSSSVLRARLVNKHWASCLAGVVDTLYIVPEYFLNEESTKEVHKAFPKANTVNLDLQDTFIAVSKEVKDSLDRYAAQRLAEAVPGQADASESAAGEGVTAPGDGSTPSTSAATALAVERTNPQEGGPSSFGLGMEAPEPPTAAPGGGDAGGSSVARPTFHEAAAGAADVPRGAATAEQPQQPEQPEQPQPLQPEQPPPQQPLQPLQPPPPQQQQQQHPIAALAAAFAVGFMNGNPGAGVAPAAALLLPAPGGGGAAAANAALSQTQPTCLHSAIPVDPLPGVVPPITTHLRVRLPDSTDVQAHQADMATSWDYISALLSRVGPKLSGLSLSTAPDAAHISMLAPLTQLTSLTMDEASHANWSTEHLPIVGSLTGLRNLAIKIPPFRNPRPEPLGAPGQGGAAGGLQHPQPGALSSWTALQKLTKLHVSALRYSFHSSLVAVLPYLTKLEYLALRAPQTRLPWPGTDKPLFANIGLLTGLTQLSLALGDHNMVPQDWQSLTTLARLSAIEISVSEGSDGLNVPGGLDFPSLRNLKLRYPNSQDLVRIAGWSSICKLDIKFPEHEREWHQEDAVVELLDFRNKLLPNTAGAAVIAAVLDSAPAAAAAALGAAIAAEGTAATATGGALGAGAAAAAAALDLAGGLAAGPAGAAAAAAGLAGVISGLALGRPHGVGVGVGGALVGGAGAGAGGDRSGVRLPPTGPGNTAGLTKWWSPLLPLLALPNMTDFRCSAKEGLASHTPILFDEIVAGLCASWPGITRLCFKGDINMASQPAGWDALRALTKLQQLELRHHPPLDGDAAPEHAAARAARNKVYRVEPIKLPATSLPDSLQTLLLENVELRRKEKDCLVNLTSLERRTTCRHFPEFEGMPLQRLVVSNCCVKAKGISSIANECAGLTHLVFAVYKVTENKDLLELQSALRQMVRSLSQLQVLKVRVLAGCITKELVQAMVAHLPHLQRLKLTSSDGWADTAIFLPLTRMTGLRKCSLAYFKSAEAARLLRAEFRVMLPYCKVKAKHET